MINIVVLLITRSVTIIYAVSLSRGSCEVLRAAVFVKCQARTEGAVRLPTRCSARAVTGYPAGPRHCPPRASSWLRAPTPSCAKLQRLSNGALKPSDPFKIRPRHFCTLLPLQRRHTQYFRSRKGEIILTWRRKGGLLESYARPQCQRLHGSFACRGRKRTGTPRAEGTAGRRTAANGHGSVWGFLWFPRSFWE